MHANLQIAALLFLSIAVRPLPSTAATANDWSLDYEDDGRLKELTGPGGWHASFGYEFDYQDRLTQFLIRHDDGLETVWSYDDYGRLVQMTDQLGPTWYDYDGFGRLTSVRRQGSDPIYYAYDSLDRLRSVRVGDDWLADYNYDFLGNLEAIATPAGEIEFERNPENNSILRRFPNGIRTLWEFNPDGTLGTLTHADRDNYVMARYTYSYRANGQIASVSEWSPGGEVRYRYEYDALDRLIGDHSSAGVSHTFEYDQMGYRTAAVSSSGFRAAAEYTAMGLMDRLNGGAVRLDEMGNITSLPTAGGRADYAYDERQHLREMSRAATRVSYQYDGLGRVVSRSANGRTTTFIPDPLTYDWRPLVSRDPIGQKALYVHSAAAPLARITGSGATFFLEDQTGSVRLATDQLGRVTGRFDYDPFGRPLGTGPTGIRPPDLDVRPAAGGGFYDRDAGLYLTPFGMYDPSLGRNLQPTPFPTVMFGPALEPIGGFSNHSVEIEGSRQELINTVNKGILSLCGEFTGNKAFGAVGLGIDVFDFYGNSNLHPGDPALWAQGSSAALSAAALLTSGLTSATLGGAAPLVGLGYSIGTKIRSRVLQNRALDLVQFPLGVASQTNFSLQERFSTHSGQFCMTGNDAFACGGWTLSHQPYRQSISYANFAYREKVLYDGSLATGSQQEKVIRAELDGTLYIRSTSHSRTTCYYNGAAINKAMGMEGNYAENLKKCYAEAPPSKLIETFSPDMDRRNLPELNEQEPDDDVKRRYRPFFDGGDPPDHMGGGPSHSGQTGGPFADGSPLSPANVGGVYLSGAGRTIRGLGALRGVAVDPVDGRLTLLSQNAEEWDLPPMRLDDLVTIFRAVYDYGQSPSVSIDPDSLNPRGPRMVIAHGPGTGATYPGWVLFECDRIMKCYSLGADNLTGKALDSRIDGYSSVLDRRLRSGSQSNEDRDIWERFWIVPAEVKYREAPRDRLTLADVALKVRTQRMEMKNGRLVPARDCAASPEADDFASWFGDHFAQVSREYHSTPPQAVDGGRDIDVFAELYRIALVAAIAENLRDEGVPLPAWMNDYAVEPFEMPDATPSITVTKSSARYQHSVFGGVSLSPEDRVVQRVVGGAIGEEGAAGPQVEELARRLNDVMREVEPLQSTGVKLGQSEYQATALPGAATRELGACRLSAVDLEVPIQRGAELTLRRHYHSFFSPHDVTGPAWTFDLPILVTQPHPVRREGDDTEFSAGYYLTSPLGSVEAVFQDSEPVPGYDVPLVVPRDAPEIIGIAGADREDVGEPTTVVLFRDGQEWHFREDGMLVARSRPPVLEVFRRDPAGRIQRIEGWYGEHLRADMVFQYDSAGRLQSVTGSDGGRAEYVYDSSGLLAEVRNPDGRLQYQYRGNQVVEVRQDGEPLYAFVYDGQGRVLQEQRGEGPWLTLTISTRENEKEAGYAPEGQSELEESVIYDDAMRPQRQVLADGRHIRWRDRPDGSRAITSYYPDGRCETRTVFPDRGMATVQVADGGRYVYDHDSAGRLLDVRKADRGKEEVPLVSFERDGRGVLSSESYETCAILRQFREDGVLSGLVVTDPKPGKTIERWAQLDFDEAGRPIEVSDCWGRRLSVGYDHFGQPARFAKIGDDGKSSEWVRIDRDDNERVRAIETSWGYAQSTSYDSQGQVERMDCSRGEEHFTINCLHGKPSEVVDFNGAKTLAHYYQDGSHRGLIEEMSLPGGLRLQYDYNDDNKVASVAVGEGVRVEYTYDALGRVSGISKRSQVPEGRADD